MSRTTVNYLVGGGAIVVGLGLYAGLILVPALSSYTRLWERVAAGVLTLYVLALLIGAGIGAAAAAIWFWG